MQASQLTAGVVAILCPALIMLSWHYWERVHAALGLAGTRGYGVWILKGLVVPMGVWTLLHTGWISSMPPLAVTRYSVTPGSIDWLIALPAVLAPSALVMASFWTAATFLDLLAMAVAQVENRSDRLGVGGFWLLVTVPFAAFVLYVGGWAALGFALLASTIPMTHAFLPLLSSRKHVPLYSRAIARMKFGKYADAEKAVLEELEQATEDFDGWMLLAELYAEHFNDLPQAEATVRDLCDQPTTTPLQISLAAHRLADWHLRLAEDPVAARRALATIIARIPNSHFAHMARLRINQLPASREALRQQKEVRPIRLPALQDPLDDQEARPPADRLAAAAKANQWADRLRENPNDVTAREQFARLLAEDLGQVDLALQQVDLLLGLPDVPPAKVAEWLSWQAAWHLRFRQDRQTARILLQRVVREFPDSPQAFPAQRRLNLLDMDARLRQCSASAQLGTLTSSCRIVER